MKVSVIVPAHNEERSIAATLDGLLAHVRTPAEILVVADHCTDQTEEIVRGVAARDARVRLLRNANTKGFGNTVTTGLRAAAGDAVVPFMADSCDDPATVDRMAAAMEEREADVVCASRYMPGGGKRGGPIVQNVLSRAVSIAVRLLAGIPTRDVANSYKMYRTTFLRTLDLSMPGAGTEYSMALLLRAFWKGGMIVEIPTHWRGKSIPVGRELRIFRRTPGYWRWMLAALSGRDPFKRA